MNHLLDAAEWNYAMWFITGKPSYEHAMWWALFVQVSEGELC